MSLLSAETVLTVPSWLIAVALVITIFSLALEPFVQQIALFRSKETFPPSNLASIRRANDSKLFIDANLLSTGWQTPVQGYVMKGVLSNHTSAFSPTCPSGKCTWDEFDTLAICSKCVDATQQVTHKGYCKWNPETAPGAPNSTYVVIENCTYTINNHLIETVGGFFRGGYWAPVMLLSPFIGSSYDDPVPAKYIAGWQQPTFGVHRLVLDQRDLDKPLVEQAQECALSYCITRHNATMVGSALQMNSYTHAFGSTADWLAFRDNNALTWRSPASNQPLNDSITSKYDDYTGSFTGLSAYYLGQALGSILTGNTTFQPGIDGIQYDSLMGYESYVTTDFPALMERVATSLNQALLADPTTSKTITGNALSVVSILHVRWEWVSLPAVLLASSLAFLLLTIVISRRQRSFIWKTSSLPLLFHGVESPEDRWATLGTIRQMDHEADKTEVRLGGVYGSKENPTPGWRLIASQETDIDASKLEPLGTRTDTPSSRGPKQHDTARVGP